MSSQTCTHIKVTGVRCGGPALRGEQFCYFHQRMHRGVRTPPQARLHPIALIEDEESIQTALMEVINALMRNTIDLKRAGLILRALHIAVRNAGRAKIAAQCQSAVTEIPDYAAPETDDAAAALGRPETNHVEMERHHVETDPLVRPASAASLSTTNLDKRSELDIPASAEPNPEFELSRILYEPSRILTAAERAQRRIEIEAAMAECRNQPTQAQVTADGQAHLSNNGSTAHVGTGTPARASDPELPGRGKTATSPPAQAINRPNGQATNEKGTNGKGTSSGFQPALSASKRSAEKSKGADRSANQAPASAAEAQTRIQQPTAPRKKPPLNVRQAPAPKERKNAAHTARCG